MKRIRIPMALAATAAILVSVLTTTGSASASTVYNQCTKAGTTATAYAAWYRDNPTTTFPASRAWCINYVDAHSYPTANDRLVWQSDGNLVEYRGFQNSNGIKNDVIWASGTNGRGAYISFDRRGYLAILDAHSNAIWTSGTAAPSGVWAPGSWYRLSLAGYYTAHLDLVVHNAADNNFDRCWSPASGLQNGTVNGCA